MFDALASLVSAKADLQCKIDAVILELPQVETPELDTPELCRYHGNTPEGLVTKMSDTGLVYDVWHDRRYYGRYIEEDAKTVFSLVTIGNAYA